MAEGSTDVEVEEEVVVDVVENVELDVVDVDDVDVDDVEVDDVDVDDVDVDDVEVTVREVDVFVELCELDEEETPHGTALQSGVYFEAS